MVILIKMEVRSSNCSWSFMASRAGGREAASSATMSSMSSPPSPGGGGECITMREGLGVAGEHAELERPAVAREGRAPASPDRKKERAEQGLARPSAVLMKVRGGAEQGPARPPASLTKGRGGADLGLARPPAVLTKGRGGADQGPACPPASLTKGRDGHQRARAVDGDREIRRE